MVAAIPCPRPSPARPPLRSARGLGLPALQRGEPERGEGRRAAPGRRRHAVALGDERRGAREVAVTQLASASAERWSGSSASAPASRTSWTCRARDRACPRCPTSACWPRGDPAPAQDVLDRDVGERARRPLQDRSRGGVPVGDQQREAVEQQVERTRVAAVAGRAWMARQISGRRRARRDGGRRCRPRPRRSGRSRERAPGRTARAASRPCSSSGGARLPQPEANGDLAAQQVGPRALELVERARLRRRQQPQRRVERAGLEARLRGGQRALRAPGRVGVSATARCRNAAAARDAAASLRSAGRALELGGDLLVGPGAARARCQARRSGSVSASVASASARCTRRRSSAAAER